MALFGARSPLQRTLAQSWKTDEEKHTTLAALREDGGVKAGELLPLLWNPDSTIRNTAAAIFVNRADPKSAAALLEQMLTQHVAARAFGMRIAARLQAAVLVPALEKLLRDASTVKQNLAWEVALEAGGEVRSLFAERAVRKAPPAMRLVALGRLLADRGPAGIQPLLIELCKDPEDKLRERAVEATATLGGGDVFELMLDCFAHDNAAVRAHASAHIRAAAAKNPDEVRPRMLKLLSEGDDTIRRLSVELLLASGSPDGVILEILQYCRSLLGWLRTRILDTLKTFGDEALRPAVALLEHPDEDVRMQALVLAEHFDDPRVLGPVVKLLSDADWWLRITACETLGKLKDQRAVPHLIKALEDSDTRWAAIDALGMIGGESALRALVGLLRDPRAEVRHEVLQATARSKDPRLTRIYQQVMDSDPAQEVRTRAAEMLRQCSGTDVGREMSTAVVRSGQLTRLVDRLLAEAREKGASDIHVTVDEPPLFRINGVVERIDAPPLSAEETRAIALDILDATRRALFEKNGEVDFCHPVPGVGRYRANAFVQRKGTCISFRCIPNIPPTFADLRLPGHLTSLLDYHQGVILVTGPAGGGKSTTLAAIVNLINETRADHIITLEDPIEFTHPAKSALVNQREVGQHTESFSRALRAALREDPDVIMVGEMRDIETIRNALTAAETGHLVIATMHTTSAIATIDRLIESFPPDEQPQLRVGLSESLKYVIAQSLVRRADGKGRVAIYEILKGTLGVSNMIRENKTYQLPSLMQTGSAHGMQTVDDALEELLQAGLIKADVAYARAEKKERFEARMAEESP